MKIKIFQKGFNYSQDGQGNRLVYHLQGCNMRCPWCANPEGMGAAGYACVEYDVDELLDEIVRGSPMFFDGGGVTLTGGEATLQFDAVWNLFTKLRAIGIDTALETNATHTRLSDLFPLICELIVDLKHYDNTVHKAHTGVGNEIVLSNILKARECRERLLVRIPLVSGFNAEVADIPGFVRTLKEFNYPGLSVELLTYHEYGCDKWEKCGMEYRVENGYVADGVIKKFISEFNSSGIKLIKT